MCINPELSWSNIYLTGYTLGDLQSNTNQGDADVFVSMLDTDGSHQWTSTLGSFFDDMAQSITIDSSDNLIISGFTLGDLNGETNAGSADQFIAKYNNAGVLQWYQQIGTTLDDRAYAVVVNSDDSLILGGYTSGDLQGTNAGKFDAVVHKLNSDGSIAWTTQLGSSEDDVVFALSNDSSDNVYATGYTVGDLDNQANLGQQDMFLIKLDSAGNKQ